MSVATRLAESRLIVVMGTTGCGKSTIAEALSTRLGAIFIEGDDYHSPENKAKMASGKALIDKDRWPWLLTLSETIRDTNGKTVTSCSCLKQVYRELITKTVGEPVLFVHLHGTKELLASRLSKRQDHFMSTELLVSQLETLEPPDNDEFSLSVDVDASVNTIVNKIVSSIV